MDKYQWKYIREGEEIPTCKNCEYYNTDRYLKPCVWCYVISDHSIRNYFKPQKTEKTERYPYVLVPDNYVPDCEICKFDGTNYYNQPCCDCTDHSNNRCYFQPADNETIIRQAIKEIDRAREDLNELHLFAQSIGLKRQWFQDHPRHPHYDIISERARKRALQRGAKLVNTREPLGILQGRP